WAGHEPQTRRHPGLQREDDRRIRRRRTLVAPGPQHGRGLAEAAFSPLISSGRAVAHAGDANALGAVRAAVEHVGIFDPVTDDPATAVGANGRERLNRAF